MVKARIDRMVSGRVKLPGVNVTTVSRTSGVRISNGTSDVPAGELEPASSTGAHVTEFQIYVDGESFSVDYRNSSAANNYAVAYYDSSMALIGGIQGGSGTAGAKIGVIVTPPTGTRFVRVFGTSGVEAAFVAVHGAGVYPVTEIKVKPAGYSSSMVVWPTVTTWKIVPNSAEVRYSRYNGARSSIHAGAYNYAYIVATVQEWLGETLVRTITGQRFNIQSLSYVDSVTLNGVTRPAFFIGSQNGEPSIEAYNLGTTQVNIGLDCKATGEWNGLVTPAMWVYQDGNKIESTSYTRETTTGYRIELSNTDFTPSGGSTVVTGYAQKRHRAVFNWTSEATTNGDFEDYEEEATPTSISVSPSTGVTISGTRITFPANTGSDEKTYAVTATWSGYSATEYAYVYGQDTGRTYSNLQVAIYYPDSGIISVNGGSMYPVVTVSMMCNGSTLTGSVSDGSTAVEVSGGGYTATVNLAYYGAENGLVSAPSRGTNPDDSNTLLATVSVIASKGNLRAYSDDVSVYQQRNVQTVFRQGSFNVADMTITPTIDGTAISGDIPAAAVTVSIEVRVAGSGTTTEYEYTTGLHSGGTAVTKSLTDPPLSQDELSSVSVTSAGSAVAITRLQFTASNQHNLTDKTYAISATYEGTTRTASVQQAADAKKDGSATQQISLALSANNLTAGGGYVDVIATAYSTAGKVWESDGTPVSGESSTTDNTSSVLLDITQSSQGAFPSVTPIATDTTNHTKTFRISHRDMTNNITTDTISVTARNGSAQSSALSYSVSNALETTEYEDEGEVVWGTAYPEIQEYLVSLSIGDYTSPDSPAPSNGGSTTYSVSARHRTNDYRDGTVTINYYRRYTSWSAEKDDASHKELVRTEYDTTTYAHQSVPNSQRIVTGDSAAISVVGGTPSWLQITPTDATHGTIQFSAQSVDNAVRYVTIRATHADDATAYAQSTVWQQAYQSLTASPLRINFGWRGNQSQIVDVDARYVTWGMVFTGGWFAVEISTDGGITYVTADETTIYGSTSGLAQAKLRIIPLSPNDPDHNPTGYSEIRLGNITLAANPSVEGVSPLYLQITQDAYDGGLPTD